MAMDCLRLFTLRPLPDFSLPLFNLCISFFTFSWALGLYLRLLLERERLPDELLRRERADAERELPLEDRDERRELDELRGRFEREELREEERERELRER